MWAEGPYYFELTLAVALPYWHALRANDFHRLDWPEHSDESMTDPFTDSRFTNALLWHADLVSPDGRTLPLDDGNRTLQLASSLLRWSSSYGNYEVGRKFAWIHDASTEQDGNAGDWLHVQEISIPRLARPTDGPTPSRWAPPTQIGNSLGFDQQVLYRYSSRTASGQSTNACSVPMGEDGRTGECHFVLLNGEHGHDENDNPAGYHAATTSGEGHEQPDGLQLLYSIDGYHVLDDAGYVSAPSYCPAQYCNDDFNERIVHNVMTAWSDEDDTRGGVQAPWMNETKKRKNSDQRGVFPLDWSGSGQPGARLETQGPVVVLSGGLTWQHESDWGAGSFTELIGRNRRTTLFVPGPEPYLIDINRGYVPASSKFDTNDDRRYSLRYFLGGVAEPVADAGQTGNFHTLDRPGASSERTAIYISEVESSRDYVGTPPSNAQMVWVFPQDHGALPEGDAGDAGLNYPNTTAKRSDPGDSLPTLAGVGAGSTSDAPSAYATFVSFIAACEGNQCADVKPSHWTPPSGSTVEVQYYSRDAGQDPSGADLLDVILVRSAGVYAGDMSRAARTFSVPSHTFGANQITLAASNDEGFVRFRKNGENWEEVDRYNVSVTPLRHLTASIGGPSNPTMWTTRTWTANTQYGIGSGPTYRWDYMNTSCGGGGLEPVHEEQPLASMALHRSENSRPNAPDPGADIQNLPESGGLAAAGAQDDKGKPDKPKGPKGPGNPNGPGDGPTTQALPCNEWHVGISTSQNYTRNVSDQSFRLRLTVTRGSETLVRTKNVYALGGGGGTGPTASDDPEAETARTDGVPSAFALHAPAPNPVRDATTLGFDLPEASDVWVAVYDARGRVVREVVSERMPAGAHEVEVETAGLAGGVYVVQFSAGPFQDAQTFTVVR